MSPCLVASTDIKNTGEEVGIKIGEKLLGCRMPGCPKPEANAARTVGVGGSIVFILIN